MLPFSGGKVLGGKIPHLYRELVSQPHLSWISIAWSRTFFMLPSHQPLPGKLNGASIAIKLGQLRPGSAHVPSFEM